MRRAVLASCLSLAAVLAVCAPAEADVFGPIGLASDGFIASAGGEQPPPQQQALYAHDPAISADGRYVAFDGYFGGRTGVWRRNLSTGEVQPVAVGLALTGSEACAQPACDAELPSISANGQMISFTTTAQLDPADARTNAPNVFVRNMEIPEGQSGAYTLVSAVNGKSEGLSYQGGGDFGAVAAGRSAISANGQKVAFVTTAVSNLAACQPGAPAEAACSESSGQAPAASTPALQVAVRDMSTRETQLVSEEYDRLTRLPIPDQPVSQSEGASTYGAVYSPVTGPPAFPFDNRAYTLPRSVGASISADGTTIAWIGTNVNKQAEMLSEESMTARYTEPLWRRMAGPPAPTRRVTGGSEPENPLCAASGLTRLPAEPCQGPFAVEAAFGVWAGTVGESMPQLSADGYRVAFLASAQLVSLGVNFGRSSESELDDLYVSDMHQGLTRNEALRPLTQVVTGREGSGPITDLAISADGTQVAFTTPRIEFPLGSPAYVSQARAVVEMSELFDVNLADDTMTRVTDGYEGGPGEHPHKKVLSGEAPYKPADGALSPSFSEDGNTLAFASTASNLVYGDGNTPPVTLSVPQGSSDGSDVFVISRKVFPPESAETYVSGNPPNPAPTPPWSLSVTSQQQSNGSVDLYIAVPGAGSLTATAASAVPLSAGSSAARTKRAHRGAAGRRAHAGARVLQRTVAAARRAVGPDSSGLVKVTLAPAASYRSLTQRAGGLSGTVTVLFSAAGQPTLKQIIAVVFASKAPTKASRAARRRASARSRRAR